MLRLRIITSLLILPLTLWLIIATSNPIFIGLCAIVLLYAAHEWANLIGLTTFWQQLFFILLVALTMFLSLYMSATTVFIIALFWWLLAMVWIVLYPYGVYAWNKLFILILMGVEVLMPCWLALIKCRIDFGYDMLIYFLSLIWAADIGAYFAGRAFGKHKLAPQVSPGKTIEGVLGGIALSLVVALFGAFYFKLATPMSWVVWFSLALLTVLISVVGDLLASLLKRNRGVKDSGQLLPGHGGLLDRIDSLTAAAPLFVLGLILFRQLLHFN